MPKKPELSPEDQALREQLGLSIRSASVRHSKKPQDVATAGGISLAHQYRIESGERTPDGLYLVKVSAYLGVSLDELCGAQGQGTTSPKRVAKQTENKEPGSVQVGNMTNNGNNAVQVHGSKNKISTKRS